MYRSIILVSVLLMGLLLGGRDSSAETKVHFMETPVNLTIRASSGGDVVKKQTTPRRVREAVTALHGEEKRMQVYLIQRFLADAKAKIEISVNVEGDVYNLNNKLPQGQSAFKWEIRLTSQEKVKTLVNFLNRP